ncbi:DUF1801 domain-containing protein [Castellaniella denitrificans]|uniref:DUF1801 domain-containing protein n=1 Tax=Castellaniella denitrificans TaxID=56119 RepID=UPI001ACB8A1C|nr:DUF1801 domain-containing protein [Burkholderiales bacterium]
MPQSRLGSDTPAAQKIDAIIAGLGDWRGDVLARIRRLIRAADPDIVEEVKWVKPTNPAGVPVWSHHGIVCTGESYRSKVKLTFARGASIHDPDGLFNASLDAGVRRAIDIHEHDSLDEAAFRKLIQAAVAVNTTAHDG